MSLNYFFLCSENQQLKLGTRSIRAFGPKICNSLPHNIMSNICWRLKELPKKKTVANNVKAVWQVNLSIHVVFSLKNHPPFTGI